MSGLFNRVKQALENDNTIATPINLLHTAEGFDLDYMEYLGLTKADLKKLESKGLAIRGYSRLRSGNRVKWVLVSNSIYEVQNEETKVQEVQQTPIKA